MPIEIRELHIKINVDNTTEQRRNRNNENQDKDKIIEACVERVMELLSKKEER